MLKTLATITDFLNSQNDLFKITDISMAIERASPRLALPWSSIPLA
jgi:hypothetical protein